MIIDRLINKIDSTPNSVQEMYRLIQSYIDGFWITSDSGSGEVYGCQSSGLFSHCHCDILVGIN